MRKTKAYREGYDYAIKCGTCEEDWSDYNPYRVELKTEKKKHADFVRGRSAAVKFMKKENAKIEKASYILDDNCLDGLWELTVDFHDVVSSCNNSEKVRKLLDKYENGLCALMEIYDIAVLKDEYYLE